MDYLDKIADYKRKEIEGLTRKLKYGSFASSLRQNEIAIIGEVKRRSPSRGDIGEIENPLDLAMRYCAGGVGAISVLTDSPSFGGDLEDLRSVSQGLLNVPVLRKDFILHPLQLAEAALAGASAVLLIVRLLGENLKSLLEIAANLELETLTEIHDEADLEIALKANAPIIGVNHRDLQTFKIDLALSERLHPQIPSSIITVAESGIRNAEDAQRMKDLGYDAILVGEALVSSKDPAGLIRSMKAGKYES